MVSEMQCHQAEASSGQKEGQRVWNKVLYEGA